MGNKTKNSSEKVVEPSSKIKEVKIDVPSKSISRKGSDRSSKDYKVLYDEVKRLNTELEISKKTNSILKKEFNNYKTYTDQKIEKINEGIINQTRIMKDNMDGINDHICTILNTRENMLDDIGTNCNYLENKLDFIKKISITSAVTVVPLFGYMFYRLVR